ncbi:MAG: lipase family alpha/beta hydrolase, partial [Anaerolineae bacterium]
GTRDFSAHIEAAPIGIEKLVYLKISLALRRQVDLYEFPYDWRRPIEQNGDLLHQCIERWADGNPDQQFTLVGHSMGGIVARAYLARHTEAAERRIKRLIMHGTPHFGAAGAVEGMAMGNRMMAIMTKLNQANVPQRLMLNMPSVYQLLPAPPDLFPSIRPYPANWDLYDAAAWRLEGIRQDYLDAGRQLHELLAAADPQVDVIEIAGCHVDTVVEVQRSFGRDETPEHELIRKNEGPDAGDGTVPLWSAVLPGATIYYIQQVHRYLPKNKRVIDATLDLIHNGTPSLPTELPPRDTGLLGHLLGRDALAPADVEAERLRQRLEDGTASEEDLTLLYFAM